MGGGGGRTVFCFVLKAKDCVSHKILAVTAAVAHKTAGRMFFEAIVYCPDNAGTL